MLFNLTFILILIFFYLFIKPIGFFLTGLSSIFFEFPMLSDTWKDQNGVSEENGAGSFLVIQNDSGVTKIEKLNEQLEAYEKFSNKLKEENNIL